MEECGGCEHDVEVCAGGEGVLVTSNFSVVVFCVGVETGSVSPLSLGAVFFFVLWRQERTGGILFRLAVCVVCVFGGEKERERESSAGLRVLCEGWGERKRERESPRVPACVCCESVRARERDRGSGDSRTPSSGGKERGGLTYRERVFNPALPLALTRRTMIRLES